MRLTARAEFMHLMGLLAGKWPHSLAIQPGGTTRSIEVQEQMKVSSILFGFRRFLETTLFGDSLENIIALDSLDSLYAWADQYAWEHSDLCRFLHIADALMLDEMGKAGIVRPS